MGSTLEMKHFLYLLRVVMSAMIVNRTIEEIGLYY